MDLDKIKDDTLIICDNSVKNKILLLLNDTTKLYNIKFMTMNEVIKSLYFDYNEKTLYYLMQQYHLKYEIADTYIKNMYFVDNQKYDSTKLNTILKYKNYLDENNLLIYDNLFKTYLKNKKIIVCERQITKYYQKVIDDLSNISQVYIYPFIYHKYPHKVLEFNTIDEEVEYVAYKICELIDEGIDINHIKIANISNDYINVIKRIFGFYNIPINLPSTSYIYGTNIGQIFINNYNTDIKETIKAISQYQDNPIYKQIIDICNKYTFARNYNDVKDMIIHDLKSTKIYAPIYSEAIDIIDYKDIIDGEYIFLLNFNLGSIPKIYKDEDFITDAIKPCYLDTTLDKNRLEKDVTIKCLDNIKNLTITYKLKTPTNIFYPSNLADNYIVEKDTINIYKSYSKLNDELKLASLYDKLIKYGSISPLLSPLKYNYNIPYMQYDNKYNKINTNDLYSFLNHKLNLSYSSLEQYNECAFKYYISNILKLNIYEDNFTAVLGTIFHHVLEVGLKGDIDIDKEVSQCLQSKYKNRVISKKDTFFIENIKENMKFVLDTIKDKMADCQLTNMKTEEKVIINKEGNLSVTFTGIIDKVLYKEDASSTILAIIDYKTGDCNIELGYLPYGLHLQLPIYLYLASNMKIKNIQFAGIYLQKVMLGIEKIDITSKKPKEDKLKLEGYSTTNEDVLSMLDPGYKDSDLIRCMKVNKDGSFSHNAKTLSPKYFSKLISLTEEQIDKCINNIEHANFEINPIQEENDTSITACKYCKYIDICFRRKEDIRKISKDKELSYLGGEE